MPLLDAARRDPAPARTLAAIEEGKRRTDAMRAEFDDLIATEQTLSLERQEHSDAVARRAFLAAATGLVGSVLLILAFASYLTRAIVRPVLGTAAMAKRLAGGDLSVRVPETGVGEIRTLELAFNAMAGSLEDARAELAASRARIVTSADETRRRIERDLHDGIQQRLVSLALNLRAAQASESSRASRPSSTASPTGWKARWTTSARSRAAYTRRSCPRADWAQRSRCSPAAPRFPWRSTC